MKPRFSISDLLDTNKMNEFNGELQKLDRIYHKDATIVEKRGRKKKAIEEPEENFEALQKLDAEDDTLTEPNEND